MWLCKIKHYFSDITHREDSGKISLCCISQELTVDRELGGIETLRRKAVDYHNVDNFFLIPLDAFFVTVVYNCLTVSCVF